mmetsp:Transcript_38961/g.70330  ORF Transcript_38961/g.70330 Transcript_38961/m.70330 type:complete len:326 (-) Transcript_38961:112-1089(-)
MAGAFESSRHQAEAARLKKEIEHLVKRARLLLHGEPNAARPPAPRAPHPRRAERERELEQALEKADWFRQEIKRMRQELESRDHNANPASWPAEYRESTDRDPMELYNLIVEKRKDLQHVQRTTEGLERVAEVQRKAQNIQNLVRPEVHERLRKVSNEVEQQKRLNVKLQADRLKMSSQRKAAEEDLRTLGSELRNKAAQLQRPARLSSGGSTPEKGSEESKTLQQLRRDVDILRGAVRQDSRKHRAMLKEDGQEVDYSAAHVESLKKSIEERETLISKLRTQLDRGESVERPPALDPNSPFSADEAGSAPHAEPGSAWQAGDRS